MRARLCAKASTLTEVTLIGFGASPAGAGAFTAPGAGKSTTFAALAVFSSIGVSRSLPDNWRGRLPVARRYLRQIDPAAALLPGDDLAGAILARYAVYAIIH